MLKYTISPYYISNVHIYNIYKIKLIYSFFQIIMTSEMQETIKRIQVSVNNIFITEQTKAIGCSYFNLIRCPMKFSPALPQIF